MRRDTYVRLHFSESAFARAKVLVHAFRVTTEWMRKHERISYTFYSECCQLQTQFVGL